MDLEKLNLIKQDILSVPFESRPSSTDFCSLYVEGRDTFKFEDADATFHAFRRFSQYEYPNYVFLGPGNKKEDVDKLLKKYPYTFVYSCPSLRNLTEYSYWMFNYCFYLLPNNVSFILTHQDDGAIIHEGWEDYVIKGNYDFIGAPWRSDIRVLCNANTWPLRTCNGGLSVRKKSSILNFINYVNNQGGQEKFYQGLEIERELRQKNPFLAEDSLFSVGFCLGFFKPITVEEALRFSIEPITWHQYKTERNNHYGFHKCDPDIA